jgi:xanthine dehydrogenase accessory factor
MEEHEAVYEAILDAMRSGEPACVLTVIEARGSTPREVGAKILLRADGSTVGTVGGGALEATALVDARKALAEGQSRMGEYSLRGQTPADLGVCGGEARVFIEVLQIKPTLLIAGAGHVGQPLAEFAHLLGFRTIVADDRAEFASEARFSHADELVVTPLHELTRKVTITPRTFVVIVTRGHEQDEAVLRQVVSSPAAYVGMIGSRRKVRTVFERLLADGVPKESLARVYAPIGLRTGGQTPAEIAVSILAEIVSVQHGGTGEPLSRRDNPAREGYTDDGGTAQS